MNAAWIDADVDNSAIRKSIVVDRSQRRCRRFEIRNRPSFTRLILSGRVLLDLRVELRVDLALRLGMVLYIAEHTKGAVSILCPYSYIQAFVLKSSESIFPLDLSAIRTLFTDGGARLISLTAPLYRCTLLSGFWTALGIKVHAFSETPKSVNETGQIAHSVFILPTAIDAGEWDGCVVEDQPDLTIGMPGAGEDLELKVGSEWTELGGDERAAFRYRVCRRRSSLGERCEIEGR